MIPPLLHIFMDKLRQKFNAMTAESRVLFKYRLNVWKKKPLLKIFDTLAVIALATFITWLAGQISLNWGYNFVTTAYELGYDGCLNVLTEFLSESLNGLKELYKATVKFFRDYYSYLIDFYKRTVANAQLKPPVKYKVIKTSIPEPEYKFSRYEWLAATANMIIATKCYVPWVSEAAIVYTGILCIYYGGKDLWNYLDYFEEQNLRREEAEAEAAAEKRYQKDLADYEAIKAEYIPEPIEGFF